MENTKIAWCDHTVNLWWGCYEVNKACDECYAKRLANRYHGPHLLWQQNGPRMYVKSAIADIKKYQARAAKEGVVYRVFINSMSDIFEKPMPVINFEHQPMTITDIAGIIPKGWTVDDFPNTDNGLLTSHLRMIFFELIKDCPNLFFILLTKRPSNIIKYVPASWISFPPENVIYMTSCPDQESLDTLLPQLLKVPGKRGLSLEPLLDEIDLYNIYVPCPVCEGSMSVPIDGGGVACARCITPYQGVVSGIHWVIVGGESGSQARPMLLKWAAKIQAQCKAAGVSYFLKQDSQANEPKIYRDIEHFPVDMQVRQFPTYNLMGHK